MVATTLLVVLSSALLAVVSARPVQDDASVVEEFLAPCIVEHGPGGKKEVTLIPYKDDDKDLQNCCNFWDLIGCVKERTEGRSDRISLEEYVLKGFKFFHPFCERFQGRPCPKRPEGNTV